MAEKLSRKRKAFISEYLKDFNGTQAAIRAGYTPSRAASTACNLLKIAIIRKEIDDRLEELKMDADEALRLLADLARKADSESVKERALEKIIDIHGAGGASELILRVVRENDADRSTNKVESSPRQTEEDSGESGEA